MADTKISALPASTTPLAGTEVLPIVQGGATVKVSVANLTAGRPISATAVTASTGNFIVGTAGQGVQFPNTTLLETVVASYKKSGSTTVATGTGRTDQYFFVDPSKTFTVTATGLGGLVTIVYGSAGEACTFFWSWNTATISILGNGGTTFVASATPLLGTLGISKSANSSVLTFKTGPSFSAGNISVCLINDYASATTDPV